VNRFLSWWGIEVTGREWRASSTKVRVSLNGSQRFPPLGKDCVSIVVSTSKYRA